MSFLKEAISKVAAKKVLHDNRIAGLCAPDVFAAARDAEVVTIKGQNLVLIEDGDEDFKPGLYAVSLGKVPDCFIKSSNKGIGREGKTPKTGDFFVNLNLETGEVSIYSRTEVEELLSK